MKYRKSRKGNRKSNRKRCKSRRMTGGNKIMFTVQKNQKDYEKFKKGIDTFINGYIERVD